MSCARPCALLRGAAFLMPLYHALKILSATNRWLKERGFLQILIWKMMKMFCPNLVISFGKTSAPKNQLLSWTASNWATEKMIEQLAAHFYVFLTYFLTSCSSSTAVAQLDGVQLSNWFFCLKTNCSAKTLTDNVVLHWPTLQPKASPWQKLL